jgi:hypothetical protein
LKGRKKSRAFSIRQHVAGQSNSIPRRRSNLDLVLNADRCSGLIAMTILIRILPDSGNIPKAQSGIAARNKQGVREARSRFAPMPIPGSARSRRFGVEPPFLFNFLEIKKAPVAGRLWGF